MATEIHGKCSLYELVKADADEVNQTKDLVAGQWYLDRSGDLFTLDSLGTGEVFVVDEAGAMFRFEYLCDDDGPFRQVRVTIRVHR